VQIPPESPCVSCMGVVLCVENYWASGRPFEILLDIETNRTVVGNTNSSEPFEEEKDPCRESIYSTGQVVFVSNHCLIKVIWGIVRETFTYWMFRSSEIKHRMD